MIRRDVIKSLGVVSLHALFPSVLASFVAGCRSGTTPKDFRFFSGKQPDLVNEVIDIIIPATKSAAASNTGVQYFLDDVFATCLNEDQQRLITSGLNNLAARWAATSDKVSLITQLDADAFKDVDDAAWFRTFKQFTMIGFFTSEEGTTRAGDYQKIPERYIGEIPATPETLAHSNTSFRF